ncbi:hypothetical protein MTY66_48030 [Mycolicibacterium sp. TY66]|uniref:hypothetical protein n=1 Tax=Mycobacteriaceae TaxID=1762 RepID=UPI001BB38454|nr:MULTISPECIES: hypothetical protein [unclassified Mycolicibacterium]BCI83178.1 hypothetical protein MTY66_48030 [Mycolicibacterium sp. TY66]BCJ79176.1 hypothetical protein MTY81_05490 [Mycolicibacterium sp. TY81]
MSLDDRIVAELRKHEPSAAISGAQLAAALSEGWQAVYDSSRRLEAASRKPGSDHIIIISNQREDSSIEPPNEFYVHLSSVVEP